MEREFELERERAREREGKRERERERQRQRERLKRVKHIVNSDSTIPDYNFLSISIITESVRNGKVSTNVFTAQIIC